MTALSERRGPMLDALRSLELIGPDREVRARPLAGGVSSDIWLIDDGIAPFVVKQPLLDLKVDGEWRVPLDRSGSEARWLETVAELVPGACPRVRAYDAERNLLAIEYIDLHHVWKQDLLAGVVDLVIARAVGDLIGRIHSRTAARPELARDFATDDLFMALRLEPFLLRLTDRHPDLARPLAGLVEMLTTSKRALVHGDVSPKNVLVRGDEVVLLDAECAWWGDPAFDLAFCIHHLLLKCRARPASSTALLDAVDAMVTAYAARIDWEPDAAVLTRTAALVPALLLARVDGRSPVEYLDETARTRVRAFGRARLLHEPTGLAPLLAAWKADIA